MAWLALLTRKESRLSLRGLGHDKQATQVLPDDPDALLTRGTIMFETRLSPDGRPQVLFGYKNVHPEHRSLVFQAIPGGGISMVQVQGRDITHAAIQHRTAGRTDVLRITYSWDCPRRWGQMVLEKPDEALMIRVPVDDPKPLNLSDIRGLMLGQQDQTFAGDMIFAALSDQIEPVGPVPTLAFGTPVATPWGYKPIETLKRGDTVFTQGGDVVPVLHAVARSVPARGSFEPIRLRSPYIGLQQDIIVSPVQRLVVDGPEVEYLFTTESVLIPARHMLNGFVARPETCGPLIQYAQVILPQHETLLIAGAPLESLYIGRLRRKTGHLSATLLADVERNTLPEHAREGHKVLKWYEAITLAKRRAA